MPNLAQKYEPGDAAEYILKLMPNELYEAGQRVKFSARVDGRYHDHKYLIRMCGEEVFQKQKAAPPQPTFISVEALGGHKLDLFSTCVGVEGLTLSSLTLAPGGSAFAGITGRKWCEACPHKNGTGICDPYNNKSPPPSVYLDTRRYNGYMATRTAHGAKETPPFTPQPQPKPSDADIKKCKDIKDRRNKDRSGNGRGKDKDKDKTKGQLGGAVTGGSSTLEDFFDGLQE
eukprot:414075-Prymnesium_polylepis.1